MLSADVAHLLDVLSDDEVYWYMAVWPGADCKSIGLVPCRRCRHAHAMSCQPGHFFSASCGLLSSFLLYPCTALGCSKALLHRCTCPRHSRQSLCCLSEVCIVASCICAFCGSYRTVLGSYCLEFRRQHTKQYAIETFPIDRKSVV